MITEPKLERRAERRYMAIHTRITENELRTKLPSLIDEVRDWMRENNVTPVGSPICRYRVFDLGMLEVDVGIPIGNEIPLNSPSWSCLDETVMVNRFVNKIFATA